MKRVEVSTVIYLPPEAVYEFLTDFPRYAKYSEHLRDVTQDGDGGPGTIYRLRFAWWKLGYTAHSRVTAMDPPHEINWRIVKDVDADGEWRVEPVPEKAPPDRETATRVRLVVRYDPDSAGSDVLDLPMFVSLGWVVDRVQDLVVEEGERVVERIVADLEGEPREVDLDVDFDA